MDRYSVIKMDPPPATRLSTPKRPPPPPNWVCVVIWIELLIHESSPASEMMVSFGSRANSRTGMVVPVMRLCMTDLLYLLTISDARLGSARGSLRVYQAADWTTGSLHRRLGETRHKRIDKQRGQNHTSQKKCMHT